MGYATSFQPSTQSFLGVAREATTQPGTTVTPVMPVATIPVDGDSYEPEDVPEFLRDDTVRDVMSALFGDVLGPESATFSYGGPFFPDSYGYVLDNVLGDLSTTSNGTLGTARNLSAGIGIGATSLAVGSSLGAVTTGSIVQIADGAASEVVVATSGSTGTAVNFTGTPTRFAHTTAATAALQSAATSYTHVFAALNSGSGQPPSHTLTDYTGLTATVGARAYASSAVAQLTLTGDATGLIMAKFSGLSYLSAPAASKPSAGTTFTVPLAGWVSTVTAGGAAVPSASRWAVTLTRELATYWPATGSLTPWAFPRGPLTATGELDYAVPSDETPLTQMLAGAPLTVAISASNGLGGASALSLNITASQAVFVKAKPARAVVTGYADQWEAVANTTDVGGSGGTGPLTVTITNAVAAY